MVFVLLRNRGHLAGSIQKDSGQKISNLYAYPWNENNILNESWIGDYVFIKYISKCQDEVDRKFVSSRWGFCDDSNELPQERADEQRHKYFTVETTVLSGR